MEFFSLRIFFSDNTRVRIFIFFVAQSANFVFQNLTLGYDKNSESNFFFLHQNQNIFFSNIGNQNIFLEKNHNPPFKLNGRSLSKICRRHNFSYHRYADDTQVYLVIYPDAWRLLN